MRRVSMDSWGEHLAHFKQQVDGISTMVILSTLALGAYAKTLGKTINALVASGEVERQASDDRKSATYSYSQGDSMPFDELRNTHSAVLLLWSSGIVSLVTEFEQLIGRLVRTILTLRPEIWQSCDDSKLSSAEAVSFPSMEALRESLLDRTVGSVLRNGGPADQFRWLESRVGITLTKDLDEWAPYIELTERRNLLIHSDGCVTNQYLRACQDAGVTWASKPSVGDQLSVDPGYYVEACTLILTLGAKLTHVLWRKISPAEIEVSDSNLSELVFDLVRTEKCVAAQRLGAFALNTLKKHPNEQVLRTIIVNTAQAYKWDDQPDKCKSLLDSRDWRASSDEFTLAIAVLRDDYATAVRLMHQLGKSSELMTEDAYKTWPLFREARKRSDFLAAYEEVFGHRLKVKQSLSALWHEPKHQPQSPAAGSQATPPDN
jgi:hypothetical protein